MSHDQFSSVYKLNAASAFIDAMQAANQADRRAAAYPHDQTPRSRVNLREAISNLRPRSLGALTPKYAALIGGVVVLSGAVVVDWLA